MIQENGKEVKFIVTWKGSYSREPETFGIFDNLEKAREYFERMRNDKDYDLPHYTGHEWRLLQVLDDFVIPQVVRDGKVISMCKKCDKEYTSDNNTWIKIGYCKECLDLNDE